jgi:hypothetical protein
MVFNRGIQESVVYKTELKFRERSFSALTYFKPRSDSVFSLVLLSTFGNTLLEAEISPDDFKVRNVNEYLNRKPFLNLLEKDWRLLLQGNFITASPYVLQEGGQKIFIYKNGSRNSRYHYSYETASVSRIESFKGNSIKTLIRITPSANPYPLSFSIEHPGMDLSMNFTMLEKPKDDTAE